MQVENTKKSDKNLRDVADHKIYHLITYGERKVKIGFIFVFHCCCKKLPQFKITQKYYATIV